jgi:hypothetical protein
MTSLMTLWALALAAPEGDPAPAEATPTAAEAPAAEAPAGGADARVLPRPRPNPMYDLQGAHGADALPPDRRADRWNAWGELRGRAVFSTDPTLDDVGTRPGRKAWGTSRLIAGFDYHPTDRTTLELEIEALNGQFVGDTTTVGTGASADALSVSRSDLRDVYTVLPRKLGVQVAFPDIGTLRIGVQTFTWGTGLLANDGAGDPDFGDPNTGSLVARAAMVFAPWRNKAPRAQILRGLGFFVAGDLVVRDDNAHLLDGDLAGAGVAGLRLQSPHVELGALVVGRYQRDRRDPNDPRPTRTSTRVVPVDVYGRFLLDNIGGPHRVLLEGEAVTVNGHTDRSYLDSTAVGGAAIHSLGALVRLRYDNDPARFSAKVEAGFASGDNDLRDDVVRSFSFHTDYNVGMLLFDELLPLITARAADRGTDPGLIAQPPPGARYTINQGAVSNTVYLNPVLRYRPVPDLDLRLGWVAAWSAADFADVYQTGVAGGYNVTPGGVSGGSHSLGHEVDLGARYTVHIPGATALVIGAEGASFLPGGAFDGVALGTQWLGRARLSLTW